jgi:hypothetical protein
MAELLHKLAAAGMPLRDICGAPLCGIVTGLKDAFLIDQRTRDTLVAHNPRCAGILKQALAGKDIRPWRIEWRRLWLIYTYHGIDITPYPAVLDYLSTFRHKLEQRATLIASRAFSISIICCSMTGLGKLWTG